ncbi:MAG: glycoside hydrolase family 127 protein [Clostridia bacterium]|nr:glycoside hydrolase family 127 protein [Clostridia bacterium]
MKTDYRNVTLTGGFWKAKETLVKTTTTDAVYDRFAETGRMDAFRCDWKEGMPNRPHIFWDSDVAKWIEGAAYILAKESRPDLEEKVEALISEIEKNQGEDGYFNIYYMVVEPQKRWTDRNCHELYCAGHLMEAACAYYEATGRRRLLDCMEKYADYIKRVFVDEKSAAFETPGHEEIELALFKMYHTTGEKKYADLAKHFLERRGQPDNTEAQIFSHPKYAQSHLPIREQKEAFGHSVRAMYLYAGMTDYAAHSGDEVLLQTCRDVFDDVTKRKMYVTGGIGSTNVGEAFTIPYDLPNAQAYTETCASIGMMFFANRLFKADPLHPSKYADAVELEMYNGALSGVSLDGISFFYENPIEIYLAERNRHSGVNHNERFPITQRVKVFGCSCCPPNITRTFTSLGEYFYAYDEAENAVYVNQFGSSVYENGAVRVTQETDYPSAGKVKITASVPVYVRVPGWCRKFSADAAYRMVNGYARFEAGEITVDFAMKPELITSSVHIVKNIGKAALRCGPVIYCVEGVDHGGDVHTLCYDRAAVHAAKPVFDETIGLNALELDGLRCADAEEGALYMPLEDCYEPVKIRAIPYHAFANRGETNMLVFLPYR